MGIATYTQYVTVWESAQDASRQAATTLPMAETWTSFVSMLAYASLWIFLVPVRGFAKGWYLEFRGIAA